GPERIDPDPPLRTARALEHRLQQIARDGLHRRDDAVLEVEDDRVGLAVERLGDLALAVGGDEQPRARLHQSGFFSISAVRVISHTSSPRWLKARCAQVTIPALGRDLLSRSSRHSLSQRSVSPAKTGLGSRTLSKPRLATRTPSVVSWTLMPTSRLKVKQLLTSGLPNSVFAAAS